MKKNTYPVAVNAQAISYRQIFDEDLKINQRSKFPGRVKGINNSPNLIALFPNSPFIATSQSLENDRGRLLNQIEQYELGKDKKNGNTLKGPLDNETIGLMFKNVIDGYATGNSHVGKQGNADGDGISSSLNYNWLYRDKPMDMNFKYLNAEGKSNAPNAENAPVGSNKPIISDLNDQPFWGHANLNVPSIDWTDRRTTNAETDAQLKRGSGGFGTVYSVSNKAFASQEKIGKYFTNSYIDVSAAGKPGEELDRMDKTTGFNGKSIKDTTNTSSDDNSNLYDQIDNKFGSV